MIKNFFLYLLEIFIRLILSLRYKITYKGLDKLDPKGKGSLFLPNHPAMFVDPLIVGLPLWRKFHPRAMITEYMYYAPGIYRIMKKLNALPVPAFHTKNSVKIARTDQSFNEAKETLKSGGSILLYPAGGLKSSSLERLGGASGVHQLIHDVPQAKIVLVRTTGLWGSAYSRAYLGRTPPLWPTIRFSIKKLLKNLIFFMPRRKVTVEFVPAPADFPVHGTRKEINQYLENWYNQGHKKPDGTPVEKGEPFVQVSYSRWGEDLLEKSFAEKRGKENYDLAKIPEATKKKIIEELANRSGKRPSDIRPEMYLADDLTLDSLDGADLILFLEEEFNIRDVSPGELTTVGRFMAIAGGLVEPERTMAEDSKEFPEWHKKDHRPSIGIPEYDNIGAVFLCNCDRMGSNIACMDERSGVLTYRQLKMRALLLADKIKQMPGDHIGILLPASVGASLLIFATLLAGKVPVMVNWTVGPRHLKTVRRVSGFQTVLTAWGFIDKLDNVDLSEIHDQLVMLEEFALEITLKDKLKAMARSYLSCRALIPKLGLDQVDPHSQAVLLFTSGTEAMPKGVPLTHYNLLSNIRSGFPCIQLNSDDSALAFLPPFHSFGFTMNALFPLLAGVKVCYSPNPTETNVLVREIEKRKITMLCGAPTFLKGILKTGTKEQLETIRMVISGAEKMPPELLKMIHNLGPDVQLLEGYGITECSPLLTLKRPGTKDAGVGIPVPGVRIAIINPETKQFLPKNTQGMILASGDNIFNGYVSEVELPSPFLNLDNEKWYVTGDLGYIDDSGSLVLSGRLKRFVKIGGEMVSLAALESAILEAAPENGWDTEEEGPSVAVCAKEVDDEKTQLVSFTRFGADVDQLNKALKSGGFSNLVRLSKNIELSEIPVTGTGKIDYRKLEGLYLG